MKTIVTTAFLLLFGFSQKAQACDCDFIPTFCEAITYQNNGQVLDYLSVYRVKVTANLGNGLQVFVSQTYSGENMIGHSLFIEDGNGANCVLFASAYLSVDKEYIIAAYKTGDTLALSECAVSFLAIENGLVKGAIAPGVSEVSLDDFPNIANCGDLTSVGVFSPDEKDRLIVMPTLATGIVTVKANQTFWAQPTELKLVVYDAAGRLVFAQNYPDFGYYTPAKVDIKLWGSGVYILHLTAGKIDTVVRLVKVG
ncbi:MAG: T9SS type A sorting domain-containing protein [Saprospiraceae bacterium]|nr:T9SS type A sorting domain-containing protein [Saprospiraceae bacterium]MCF8250369.1 T9SS type A sorting domain-containing protein [Saprospiraceae bacterium]MCF8280394.1 T9SS type A sorting domain-containing protein [Bacteroidales bacterium]MCF8312177.1 T9SS type A sorting domain-containing protein [Saprospiraceae bacterium]MCF8441859.1 T9SS type A sorting domain-containing protein [Saprospiraceae bacterium]